MFEEIYLEVDEEVTSVIEKIKKSKKPNIVLVLPRNAVLGQSVVNLKLVYKEAIASAKEVALVTTDKVTHSLAERVGFVVYDSAKGISFNTAAGTAKSAQKAEKESEESTKPEKTEEPDEEELAVEEVPLNRNRFDTKPIAPAAAVSEEVVSDAVAEESVAEMVESAEPEDTKANHEEPKSEPAAAHTYAAPKTPMIPSRGNLRFFRQQKKKAALVPIIVGAVILLSGGVGAAYALPSASVKVVVKAQPFNDTVKSNIDVDATSVDVEKATMPGKVVALEQVTKSTAKATGKKDKGTKASGTVTVYNGWDSNARSFPAGTTIKAKKSGNTFVLTKAIDVPGATSTISGGKAVVVAGHVDVAVEATSPGEAYNESATTFTINSVSAAQQDSIYASSSTAFTGGSSKVVTVISGSDISTLTNNVKNQNKDEAVAEIKKQAADSVVIDKAIQTVSQDVATSAEEGDEADSVEVTVTGKFSLITFTQKDQQELLEKVLATKIPEGQSLVTQGDGVSPDTSNYELNLVSEKRLELTNNLKAFTADTFDQNAIRRSLIGEFPKNVQSKVSKDVPVLSVDVSRQPSWWPILPLLGKKINLEITYKTSS